MQTPRITIPITQIRQGERIRTDFGDLDELIETFHENIAIGKPILIHPVVVDSDYTLIDGGRRLEAHKRAGFTDIDVAFYEVLDEGVRMRLEVDANKHKRFNWKENCLAVERYHRFYSQRSALQSEQWGVRETGALLNMGKSPVAYCLIIAECIRKNEADIIKCETMADAIRILVDRKEKEANKRLVALTMPADGGLSILSTPLAPASDRLSTPARAIVPDSAFYADSPATGGYTPGVLSIPDSDETPAGLSTSAAIATSGASAVPLSRMLFKTDCLEWMKQNPESVDHIITDIPYGIDMDNLDQENTGTDMSSVRKEHDVSDNMQLMQHFFPSAFSTIKAGGYLITWADQMLWQFMFDLATAAGFRVQRWPLTWHKTHTCINQSANVNFTKNTEIAIVCRKGNATLLKPQGSSVYSGSNDIESRLLGHPFVKPAGLWTWLYEAVALRGSTVLDPFAGVGSSTIPAIRYGLKPITCEINEDHYNRQVINVQNLYRSLNANITFA